MVLRDFSDGVLDSGHGRENVMNVLGFSDAERSRVLATVEQNSHQTFPFTVLDTVRMGRYSRSGIFDEEDESEMKIMCDILDDVGILDFAHRNVSELSGGEWRRVMIAQALAQEPDLLLLDEPTLHLDINHQFDLMELCRKIAREKGILVMVVTHDLMLAARYCDRIIVMENGSIISSGNTKEVITPELIAEVFHMKARVEYDDEINGILVTLINKHVR